MKRAAILYFTDRGAEMADGVANGLAGAWTVERYRPEGNLKPLTAGLFGCVDALIFVGACGVAVRAIAPLVASKCSDPAVIVLDERGKYVISLLSGHVGGANALARDVAAMTGGAAVITTATDVNRRFSVDAWAAQKELWISDMGIAKRFAAEILRRDLPLMSDFPITGALPSGIFAGEAGDIGAAISCRSISPFAETLLLVPRRLHLGIGCKRGATVQKLRAAVETVLMEAGLRREALQCAVSIDVKRDEAGLHALCEELGLPLHFYSAEELMGVPGDFQASGFVLQTVGADNVCERSAVRSAGSGAKLLVHKRCMDGVTVAIAQEDWSVSFE